MNTSQRTPSPSKNWFDWRDCLHPVLGLFPLNVAITIYAFSIEHSFLSAAFAILLPAAVLLVLAQALRTRIARSNQGVYLRSQRPFGYWVHITLLIVGYLFVSAAPILAPYFSPSSRP